MMLEKIANLIIEIKFEMLKVVYEKMKKNKEPKMKPLVLAIMDKEKNCYYVLGTNGMENSGGIKKNSFGNKFKNAAEKAKVRYSCDSFESAII